MKNYNKEARAQVGDGKRPNKFFITVSDYFAIKEDNTIDSCMTTRNHITTIERFDTFENARDFVDNIDMGVIQADLGFIYNINNVMIEDRLNGTIYEKIVVVDKKKNKSWIDIIDDSRFLK